MTSKQIYWFQHPLQSSSITAPSLWIRIKSSQTSPFTFILNFYHSFCSAGGKLDNSQVNQPTNPWVRSYWDRLEYLRQCWHSLLLTSPCWSPQNSSYPFIYTSPFFSLFPGCLSSLCRKLSTSSILKHSFQLRLPLLTTATGPIPWQEIHSSMLIAPCCERGFHLLHCFLKLSVTSDPSVTPHGEAWHLCCRNILPGLLSSLTSLIMLFSGKPCLPLVAVAILSWIFFQSPTRDPVSLTSLPLLIHTKISACFSDTSSWMSSYHLHLPECFTTPFFCCQFLQVVPIPGSSAWSSTSSVASLCLLMSWSSSWTALYECHTCSPSMQLNLLLSCHHQLILVVATYFPLALINTFFFPLTCSECYHLPIIFHVFAPCFSTSLNLSDISIFKAFHGQSLLCLSPVIQSFKEHCYLWLFSASQSPAC